MTTAAPDIVAQRAAINSLTLKSAAAIAIALAAGKIGVHLPEGLARDVAGALVDLTLSLGLIGVGVGRARAKGPLA